MTEVKVGSFTNSVGYLEMMLRMEITGTNAPTEAEYLAGLKRLLDHLERHPLPKDKE